MINPRLSCRKGDRIESRPNKGREIFSIKEFTVRIQTILTLFQVSLISFNVQRLISQFSLLFNSGKYFSFKYVFPPFCTGIQSFFEVEPSKLNVNS